MTTERRPPPSPVWQNLLLGSFVLPFAPNNADPTATTNAPDGLTLLWISGGTTLKMSTYSRTLNAWKTVTYS